MKTRETREQNQRMRVALHFFASLRCARMTLFSHASYSYRAIMYALYSSLLQPGLNSGLGNGGGGTPV